MDDLNTCLLAAHAANDKRALVNFYTQAADQAASPDATGFFLTHAYVYALELDLPEQVALKARLVAMGREA